MSEETKPLPIDKEVRGAIFRLIDRLVRYHPEAQTNAHDGKVPKCWTCYDIDTAQALLDADQREHGPDIEALTVQPEVAQ